MVSVNRVEPIGMSVIHPYPAFMAGTMKGKANDSYHSKTWLRSRPSSRTSSRRSSSLLKCLHILDASSWTAIRDVIDPCRLVPRDAANVVKESTKGSIHEGLLGRT